MKKPIMYEFKTLRHVIVVWEAVRDTLERNANALDKGQGFLMAHEVVEMLELLGDLAKFIDDRTNKDTGDE